MSWTSWLIIAILIVISIILLTGKGSFIIAGYNLLPKEVKEKYNKKRLCRIIGIGALIMTLFAAIQAYIGDEWPSSMDWTIPVIYLGIAAVMVILGNTICKNKPKDS